MTDLAANALTTLETVKADLGISTTTDDDFIKRKINFASQAIEDFCDRVFGTSEVTETFKAEGQLRFVVARAPIASISEITYDGTEVDSDNYEIEGPWTIRMIYAASNSNMMTGAISAAILPGTSRKLYSVTYTGGYALPGAATPTLPSTIEEACITQVISEYRQRGRDKSIKAERLLSWNATYGDSTDKDSGLLKSVVSMITPHKRIVFV